MTKFAGKAPVLVVVLARPIFWPIGSAVTSRGLSSISSTSGSPASISFSGPRSSGLATCWIGWFNARRVRKVLQIPRNYKLVVLFPLGYAASRPPSETKRKALDEIAWFNRIP